MDLQLSPTTYRVNTTQGSIAYWDSKPGMCKNPSIVFIHGHLTNKRIFQQQFASSLLSNYRLICLDLPGQGESSPPQDPEKVYSWPGYAASVCEVIHALGLESVMIVGWSLGGHVGIELITQLKQIVGMLITGTPPISVNAEGFRRGFLTADPTVATCFGKGNLSPKEAEMMAKGAGYDGSQGRQFILDGVLQSDEGAKVLYPKSIGQGVGQDEVKIIQNWPMPLAVIAGENDPFINNNYIQKEVSYKNLWRNQVVVLKGAGHAIPIENADIFSSLIQEFALDVFS